MTNQAKLIILGQIGLGVLYLAPLLRTQEGMFPGFGIALFGGLSAVALTAGLTYAAGWTLITLVLDVALLIFSSQWFMTDFRDDSGAWGVLSVRLLWSGTIVALTSIGALGALADCLRWARRTFRSPAQTEAKAVFLRPGDRGRPGD